MSKSETLRSSDVRAIYELVGECRELGDDATCWREHWASRIARLTDSSLVHTGEMADCFEQRPRDLGVVCVALQEGLVAPSVIEEHQQAFQSDPNYVASMIAYFGLAARDDGICLTRKDFIDDRNWYASADYQVVQRAFGVDHIFYCFRSITSDPTGTASGLILNRTKGMPNYSYREKALVHEAHSRLTSLVGGPLARFTEPSPTELPPRVRQTLACILEGDGDKQIATRLELSRFTVNQYIKIIFRHFGVSSRSELMARWIRRGWGERFPWLG